MGRGHGRRRAPVWTLLAVLVVAAIGLMVLRVASTGPALRSPPSAATAARHASDSRSRPLPPADTSAHRTAGPLDSQEPSWAFCVRPPGQPSLGAPLLAHVMLELTGDRASVLHLCGRDAPRAAASLAACRPFGWSFVQGSEKEEEEEGDADSGRVVIMRSRLAVHRDSLQPCQPPTNTNHSGPSSVRVLQDAWVAVREHSHNQFHGLYDQGLLQLWALWQDVTAHGRLLMHRYPTPTGAVPQGADSPVGSPDAGGEGGAGIGRRLPLLYARDLVYRGPLPFHDIAPLVLPVDPERWQRQAPRRLYAQRLLLSHYDLSLTGGDALRRPTLDDPHAAVTLTAFGMAARAALRRRFPPVASDSPEEAAVAGLGGDSDAATAASPWLLFEDRPVTNSRPGYAQYHRYRGVQPYLRQELLAALPPSSSMPVHVQPFTDRMPLAAQWRLLQRSRVVVAGEGAFFAWLLLAAPNATWVMVFNHTLPMGPLQGRRSCNYHAKVAACFPWVRLVVYVIDHGRRDSVAAVAAVVARPFVGGAVMFVGAQPDSRSLYEDRPWQTDTGTGGGSGGDAAAGSPSLGSVALLGQGGAGLGQGHVTLLHAASKRSLLLDTTAVDGASGSRAPLGPSAAALPSSRCEGAARLGTPRGVLVGQLRSAGTTFVLTQRPTHAHNSTGGTSYRGAQEEARYVLVLAHDPELVLAVRGGGRYAGACRLGHPDAVPVEVVARNVFPYVVLRATVASVDGQHGDESTASTAETLVVGLPGSQGDVQAVPWRRHEEGPGAGHEAWLLDVHALPMAAHIDAL